MLKEAFTQTWLDGATKYLPHFSRVYHGENKKGLLKQCKSVFFTNPKSSNWKATFMVHVTLGICFIWEIGTLKDGGQALP